MTDAVSIAIETSSRLGGVALGRGDELLDELAFDASRRHAVQLVSRLSELLARHGLRSDAVQEVYVSAGPGSFTGLRLGITVARTLGQAVEGLRCVAVPTPNVLAVGAMATTWAHLAVVLDAADALVHATIFHRSGETFRANEPGGMTSPPDLLASAPRPLLVLGEAVCFLGTDAFKGEGVDVLPPESPLHHPTARAVWTVGRQMARAGEFTDYRKLLPTYSRAPEALRLWNQRHGDAGRLPPNG